MKKIGVKLLQLSMLIITFFAVSTAASASSIMGYQPKMPVELQKKL
ncbi:MAG: cyclic lactone autoinducer peptide [Epulopiscium sp.]|nr:cyclic lactone autoinducer peptide [Candidatus Epulonipiscium sp.]